MSIFSQIEFKLQFKNMKQLHTNTIELSDSKCSEEVLHQNYFEIKNVSQKFKNTAKYVFKLVFDQ